MMRGVQYFGGGARTMSVVMRYRSGTIRFIDTFHRFNKEAKWSIPPIKHFLYKGILKKRACC